MSDGVPQRAAPAPAGARGWLEQRLARLWFAPRGAADTLIGAALWPLHLLVGAVAARRRHRIALAKVAPRPAGRPPIVVVGNLVVGGAGKTPLVIGLVRALAARGWRPGVLARGYGRAGAGASVRRVGPDDDAAEVGDEPLLVARRTRVPVVVGAERAAALAHLLAIADCNVVLCDDGLQHVALPRDVEIAVFDARGAGNARCLPAGPLREPLAAALLLDALVLNGAATEPPIQHSRTFRFEVRPVRFDSLDGARQWDLAEFAAQCGDTRVDAVAGIAAPQRFFDTLERLGLRVRRWPLADHAGIDARTARRLDGRWVVMTEKDAVKCAATSADLRARAVVLRIEAVPDAGLVDWLEGRLRG